MTTIGKVDHIPMETNVLRREYEIEWNIPNFSSLSGAFGNSYSSPSFSFADKSWYLKIYPNGHPQNKSVGCIGLYLYLRKSCSGHPISIEFTLGLKKLYREKFSEHHYAYTFKKGNCGYGVDGCLCRSELFGKKSDLLPADVLTVFCSFKYPKPGKTSNSIARSSIVLSENKVLQDFKEFCRKKEDCDVIIKLKGQEFPVHRAILRARSPVFASTYRHDTKEKTTDIIDIEGCEPSSFSDFLCFLYCGDTDIISIENVFSLYTTGDKYDVHDLKAKCIEFMKENLSAEIFCDTFSLALLHSEIELSALATDFFIKHALDITKTVKWQSFSVNNPTQSNILLMKALAAKSSNE